MANELQAYTTTGKTLYAVLISSAGQAWNGAAFEAIQAVNWTDYDIALTEATAGLYLANLPAVVAGIYTYVVYEQAGANPAVTDTKLGVGYLNWDGSAILPLSSIDADLATAQADLDNHDQYKADVSGLAPANEYDAVLDVAISSRLASADYTEPDNAGIAQLLLDVGSIDTNTVLDATIDGVYTVEQVLQIMISVLAGKLSRAGDVLTFRDISDTLDRIIATVDDNENRTGVNYSV